MRKRNNKRYSKSEHTSEKEVQTSKVDDKLSEGTKEPNDGKTANDPAWYARDPQLLLDTGSFPYSDPLGGSIDLMPKGDASLAYLDRETDPTLEFDRAVPGIATMYIKSTVGTQRFKTDALNVASHSMYANIRAYNSGARNYNAPDLTIYCLATSEFYSWVNWAHKIYCAALMFSQRNQYFAGGILDSMKVDKDNIINNLANFRAGINARINKIASYAVPASLTIFQRKAFMYASVYTENMDGDIKDQMYQFAPLGFYKFGFDVRGKGMLQFTPVDYTSNLKFEDILGVFDTLFENITGDEDWAIMAGDIVKAYGTDILGVSPIAEDGALIPVYDEYVLSQFHNAIMYGKLAWNREPVVALDTQDGYSYAFDNQVPNDEHVEYGSYGHVYQDYTGLLQSREAVVVESSDTASGITYDKTLCLPECDRQVGGGKIVLDAPFSSPDAVFNVEATRLMPVVSDYNTVQPTEGEGQYLRWELSSGTEIPVFMMVTGAVYNKSTRNKQYASTEMWQRWLFSNTESVWNYHGNRLDLFALAGTCHFKWYPIQTYWYGRNTGGIDYVDSIGLFGITTNYTVQPTEKVARLHEVALLSLFYVPGIGKIVDYKPTK